MRFSQPKIQFLFTLVSLMVISGTKSGAEVWDQWLQSYNGPGNSTDWVTATEVDPAGNVCTTGWSVGVGTFSDYATIKYDPAGTMLWLRRYEQPWYDKALALVIDSSGNVYVTGYSYTPTTLEDYATLKYNRDGDLLWAAHYNGSGNGNDEGLALAIDAEGNVYVTGRSDGLGTFQDCVTLKYDSTGNLIWEERYDSPASLADEALALVLTPAENLYLTGRSSTSLSDFDILTMKYDNNGLEQWVARYNGSGNGLDQAYALVVDENENVYVAGESEGNLTQADFMIIKYQSNGAQLGVFRFDRCGLNDAAQSLTQTAAGNIIATGYSDTTSGSGTNTDIWTINLNANGLLQWQVFYDNPSHGEDRARDLISDPVGSVYVTGYSDNLGSFQDWVILKYDISGQLQWVANHSGYGANADQGHVLALDTNNHLYVAGSVTGAASNTNFTLIKYAETPPASLFITVVPETNPSIVPASGGNLGMDISISNFSVSPQTFQVWTEVYAPNGFWIGPLIGPVSLNLPVGSSISRERVQAIPANAPAGNYSYACRLGSYPNSIWDEDIFAFLKLGGGMDLIVGDWYADTPATKSAPSDLSQSNLPWEAVTLHAYPNPFNPCTALHFNLPVASYVKLEVFDVNGRSVGGLGSTIPTRYEAGAHQVSFAGSNLPSGIYFAKLTAVAASESGSAEGLGTTTPITAVQKLLLLK